MQGQYTYIQDIHVYQELLLWLQQFPLALHNNLSYQLLLPEHAFHAHKLKILQLLASLGVRIRSIEGSEDKFKKRTLLPRAPLSSNCFTKKFDSSLVIPIAANTTEKFSDDQRTFACLAI